MKYSRFVRFFHWVSAVVIIWATLSGLTVSAEFVTKHWAHNIATFNVALTSVFIPLFLCRVIYRLFFFAKREKPEALNTLSVMVHMIIYGMTILVLGSGVLMLDHDVSIFGMFQMPHIIDVPALNDMFSQIHKIASRILASLVVLHVGAVIMHQIKGTPILNRMTYCFACLLCAACLTTTPILADDCPPKPVRVDGSSLSPMIKNGQSVMMRPVACVEGIKRGDFVVFNTAALDQPVIKIVRGLPGDALHIENGFVYINEMRLANSIGRPYALPKKRAKLLSLYEKDYRGKIPDNTFLALGDSTGGALDSSRIGLIPRSNIIMVGPGRL